MSTLARDPAVALCRAQVLAFLSAATTARRHAAAGSLRDDRGQVLTVSRIALRW